MRIKNKQINQALIDLLNRTMNFFTYIPDLYPLVPSEIKLSLL